MKQVFIVPAAALAALSACTDRSAPADPPAEPSADAPNSAAPKPSEVAQPAPASPAPTPESARPPLAGEALIRAEWGRAANRAACAPLFFTGSGPADAAAAVPRAAAFSGGWGVAFDQPRQRSAYGLAGTGVAVADVAAEAFRSKSQWPYSRRLGGRAGGLPDGSVAGFGLEGAQDYFPEEPSGVGRKSMAYVVIPGQRCLYNVWSHLGRQHLETLLDGLTLGRR